MQEKSLNIGYTSDIPARNLRGRNGVSQVIVAGNTCPISLQTSEQDDISITEQKVNLDVNRRHNSVNCSRNGPGGDRSNFNDATHLKRTINALRQNEDSDGESTYVKEIPCRQEVHKCDEINCSDFPPDAEMLLLKIVKQYGWLKEELTSSDVKDIADRLYDDSESHLVMHEVERITDSSRPRREAVELLLKKVIRGKPATVVAFLTTLEKCRHFLHIGKRIKKTEVSDEERKKFLLLEEISSGRRPSTDTSVTNHHFHLSDCDTEHLISHLYDKEIVDQLSDYLLSDFFISIRNHNSITNCNCIEDKIRLLVSLMMQCSDSVYDVLTKVLRKNNLVHILRGLERNRVAMVKRKSTDSEDTSSNKYAKNEGGLRQIPTEVENRVVSLLRTEELGNELNSQAVEHLGLEFSGAYKGSIVIRFTPKMGESWQKLKDSCVSGKIKEFLPHVFKGTGIESMLGEGEYRLKFSILLMPCGVATTREASVGTDQNAVFKLDVDKEQAQSGLTRTSHRTTVPQPAKEDMKENPDPIMKHWTLFVEELDPRKLIIDLKKEGLVGEDDEDKMWDLDSRKERIGFLLEKLAVLQDGDKGYKILLEHCKEHSQYVLQKIEEKENLQIVSGDLEQSTLTGQKSGRQSRHGHEMFFTGTIILNIHKRDSGSPMKENQAPELDHDPGEDYEISCPDILDPVCYFEGRGGVPELGTDDASIDFPREVKMVFEDAWSAVGEKTHPERKILVGKRKRSKQPPESVVKRLESTPTTSNGTNNADEDQSIALKDAKEEAKKGSSGDDEKDNNKTKKPPRLQSRSSTT
ncbi:hypothetical protein CHS0354_025484 [Potamilus streckersoni]|uniref:CARD domain-containing protein n=1 Tax=Potamilus streckersoni TaxID=2493646 RepID=A0AAE0RRU2_9BIVA|nr:hypothetical protein CHS0354_025484 [Potamilus streckersoni]